MGMLSGSGATRIDSMVDAPLPNAAQAEFANQQAPNNHNTKPNHNHNHTHIKHTYTQHIFGLLEFYPGFPGISVSWPCFLLVSALWVIALGTFPRSATPRRTMCLGALEWP